MKSNEASKAIYNLNPAIFRGLHIKLGFDFEQEVTIKRLPAPFTIRAAWKAIEADNLTPDNATAAIIMHDTPSDTWLSRPRMVPIERDNLWDNFDKMSYSQYDRQRRYTTVFDDFITKGDFHDLRKKRTCEAFIIAQSDDLLKPWTEPARDWTERQRDMCEGEHKQRSLYYYSRTPDPIVIDKSNYRVDLKRTDLKQRARKLRSERAKAAADAETTATAAERYNDLTQALHSARQRITDALNALDLENVTGATVESLRAIAKAIGEYSYSKGLSAAADRVKDFERNTREKRYSSPASYNSAYNDILTTLDAVMPKEA